MERSGTVRAGEAVRAVNLVFGLPASVLAAISGATALASTGGRFVAGVLALAAAGFGAVLTTFNAGQRANRATAAANAYLAMQTSARQARRVCPTCRRTRHARCSHG